MRKKNLDSGVLKEITPEERKLLSTAFILMFPSVIAAGIGAFYSPIGGSLLILALTIYQFIMLSKFIGDFYKVKG